MFALHRIGRRRDSPGRGRQSNARPRLLWLEDRTTPSTLTVVSVADSGPGSLREAVALAAPDDVVTFSPALSGHSILLFGRIAIGKSLTIDGPGASLLTVSGLGTSGLFAIEGGPRVSIDGLTLDSGFAQNAGAIDNPAGTLFLRDCV